jgi:HTH-type transcriptional regulator, competence development regulator
MAIETIGQKIHRLRTNHGLTLTQLGAKIGIDSGALSKIENGKKELDHKCLPKIAQTFSLDFETLRDEFYSERIAFEILDNLCDDSVLRLAEEKVRYFRIKNIKQKEIDF